MPEEVITSEKAAGSVIYSLVQGLANELLTTESPSKKQESMSSTVDKKDKDEDEIIKVVTLKSSKVQADLKMVTHNPPLKMKCEKSKGKGGKLKKDMMLILVPKTKGKEKRHLKLGKSLMSKPPCPPK
ncbi:hypothetical protein HD554DRAFT_2042014 [Boletus coccyginus]|nr:hypothetical protein HD554DRAFT_2042014 [Boletus coccyginus]